MFPFAYMIIALQAWRPAEKAIKCEWWRCEAQILEPEDTCDTPRDDIQPLSQLEGGNRMHLSHNTRQFPLHRCHLVFPLVR